MDKARTNKLETQYAELLRLAQQYVVIRPKPSDNLAQPSMLRVVDTVTTYGAYQTPV